MGWAEPRAPLAPGQKRLPPLPVASGSNALALSLPVVRWAISSIVFTRCIDRAARRGVALPVVVVHRIFIGVPRNEVAARVGRHFYGRYGRTVYRPTSDRRDITLARHSPFYCRYFT